LREAARQSLVAEHPEIRTPPPQRLVDRRVFMMQGPGCWHMIVGPYIIAAQEQLRAERLAQSRPVNQVPVDLFVFCKGEPPRRDLTKIGGLPYWPARREWPRAESGAPMAFVAQINFADSRDITGTLPGDLLLVFGEPEWVPHRMPLQQPDGS